MPEGLAKLVPEAMGANSFHMSEIWVEDQSDEQMRDTLLHEIIHTIWNQYNLSMHPIRPFKNNASSEEAMTSILTEGILSVMRNNPDLVEFLMEEDR